MNENTVHLRIWFSSGSNSLGHASLETFIDDGVNEEVKLNTSLKSKSGGGIYASFWPL